MLGLAYRDIEQLPRGRRRPSAGRWSCSRATPTIIAYLGEMLLLAATGDTPPPEAERLFRRALEPAARQSPGALLSRHDQATCAATIAARSTI